MISILHLPARDLSEMINHMSERRNGLLPYIAGGEFKKNSGLWQQMKDGVPVPGDTLLKVAVNDYIAAGGENLGAFFKSRPEIVIKPTTVLLFDAVARFLSARAPLSAPIDAP